MKKQHFSLLVVVTLLFVGFLLGFSFGRNSRTETVSVSVPASMLTQPSETTVPQKDTVPVTEAITFPININLAQEKELMALPGIGEVLAGRILRYREENGDFSRVTDLMNIEGIGQAKLEAILEYVTTGG